MLKIKRRTVKSKLFIILILSLVITPIHAYAAEHTDDLALKDLLPAYTNYHWSYSGFVEYGHDMSVIDIIESKNSTHYNIEGSVYDASGGASDTNYSIDLDYVIESDVITQTKEEEAMLDSKYDSIELIQTPLVEGTTWTQTVEDGNGNIATVASTITNVEEVDNDMVFTVNYKDTASEYYEERKIKEGLGVISFEKLMIDEDNSYTVGYSINESSSGVALDVAFTDVSGDDWYNDYVTKLVTMDLIDGYPDNTFKPNREISVAEFIKITVESLSFYPGQGTNEWYTPYVSKAIDLDLIEPGEFDDYNRPINRDEMTKIIVNALDDEPEDGMLEFSDSTQIEAEFKPYIYTAVELGLIAGYPSDNSFRPNAISTRAEASKLFVLLVEDEIDIKAFNKDAALSLEVDYENRLIQETEEDSRVVRDYDNMETLIEHVSVITDKALATDQVNNFYEYSNGELTLPATDGPTLIDEESNYQLKVEHPRAYKITQETSSELMGGYKLMITYNYIDEQWIIEDRGINMQNNN